MKTNEQPCPTALGLIDRIMCLGLKLDLVDNQGVSTIFVAPAIAKPATFTAMDYTTQHGPFNARYLAGFKVKTLDGVFPKGRLRAVVDNCLVVDEDLSFFEHPVDFALVPWKKGTCIFLAVQLQGDTLRPKEQIGFMLPNFSKLEVFLDLEPGPGAKLEIEAIGGEYEGRSPMYPVPSMKETS